MGTTFPRTARSRQGYRVAEVEQFLEDARQAYDRPPGDLGGLDAETIRHTAFGMERGGYSTAHVDAALERLEDAFAIREREIAYRTVGDKAWFGQARETAQEILARLARPDNRRFARVGGLSEGYNRRDVDRFCARLRRYFREGEVVGIDEVRSVAFRAQRGGYREQQVDLLLDSVVDVMLAVR
ncbi:DivIVA domain-containing protein [Amnibacterium flavum]|uniref:DivIVA domain-containing protein n=1 Tax=Amnibacterium flavum TaxID=2173173 RepID=A0A2V1HV03_9MICO|nr:DivIVA domain-containing protein [Amnibacterium flavum]PVZ96416.1 DivIVA domain-containing protein [Amnibacterium flavum]